MAYSALDWYPNSLGAITGVGESCKTRTCYSAQLSLNHRLCPSQHLGVSIWSFKRCVIASLLLRLELPECILNLILHLAATRTWLVLSPVQKSLDFRSTRINDTDHLSPILNIFADDTNGHGIILNSSYDIFGEIQYSYLCYLAQIL